MEADRRYFEEKNLVGLYIITCRGEKLLYPYRPSIDARSRCTATARQHHDSAAAAAVEAASYVLSSL
jgi:hypothetical protein